MAYRILALLAAPLCGWLAPARAAADVALGPYLLLGGAHEIDVAWQSDDAGGAVNWGTDAQQLNHALPAVRDPRGFFRVRLTDLPSKTTCYYRVRSGDATGETYAFVSPGGPDDSFVLAAYGDSRTHSDQHAKVVAALARENADLLAHTGDFVESNFPVHWRDFFRVAAPLLRRMPLLPAKGNHEMYPPAELVHPFFDWYFRPWSRPAEAASRYVVQYDGVRFIVVDSNISCDPGSAQHRWLKAALAAAADAPDVRFRIVETHLCPYSVGAHASDENVLAFRRATSPLFKEYKVDVVLSGHDHNYQRYLVDGVQYFVLGGGGAPLYDAMAQPPWPGIFRKTLNYARIEASPAQLHIVARQADGEVIEQLDVPARGH
jgi:3',5'-cyclic AMP phosphodiesterase CpdA